MEIPTNSFFFSPPLFSSCSKFQRCCCKVLALCSTQGNTRSPTMLGWKNHSKTTHWMNLGRERGDAFHSQVSNEEWLSHSLNSQILTELCLQESHTKPRWRCHTQISMSLFASWSSRTAKGKHSKARNPPCPSQMSRDGIGTAQLPSCWFCSKWSSGKSQNPSFLLYSSLERGRSLSVKLLHQWMMGKEKLKPQLKADKKSNNY